jgi:hypothetical protein
MLVTTSQTMNAQPSTHDYALVIFSNYCRNGYENDPQLAVIDEEVLRARRATCVEPIRQALKALEREHAIPDDTIAQFHATLYTQDRLFITYGDEASFNFIYDNAAHIEAEDILNALSAGIAPADYETPATAFLDYLSQLFGDGSGRIAFTAPPAEALPFDQQPDASIHISAHGASLVMDDSDRWLDF